MGEKRICLDEQVIKAIQKTGNNFNHVLVDAKWISPIGIAHIKIRHLDDFLEYAVLEAGKETDEDNLVGDYVSIRSLSSHDETILFGYYNDFIYLNELRSNLEGRHACKGKIDPYLSATDIKVRANRFVELCRQGQHIKNFFECCQELRDVYEHILQTESQNLLLFKKIYDDIKRICTKIIKKPHEVYWHRTKKDFTFCSEMYGNLYVLTLKIDGIGDAYLLTGYRVLARPLRHDKNLKRIYPAGDSRA